MGAMANLDTTLSYATGRKVRIIVEKLGVNWQKTHPGMAVDAIYNEVVGDTRRTVFCKVESSIKDNLDEMVIFKDMKMAEFIEFLIDNEYQRFTAQKKRMMSEVAKDYSGS
jgi:hypothetical protein